MLPSRAPYRTRRILWHRSRSQSLLIPGENCQVYPSFRLRALACEEHVAARCILGERIVEGARSRPARPAGAGDRDRHRRHWRPAPGDARADAGLDGQAVRGHGARQGGGGAAAAVQVPGARLADPIVSTTGWTLPAIVGWTALARVVRGMLLELRESDFVMAARLAGALDWAIIRRHLLPSFMSYLIVSLTLAVPGMILGETALSFLGLGLHPPVVSSGVLLQKAQNLRTVTLHSWLLIPAGFGCDRAGLQLPRRRPARRRRSLQVAGSAQQAQQRPGIGIELAPASTRCYPPVHRPWQQH